MNIVKQKKILGVILVLAFSMLAGCGYKDYDSCVIGEMRGQDRAVFSTVKRVCESQFPFEKNLRSYNDIRISWNHDSNNHNLINFYAYVGTVPYTITRAKVSLYTESCDLLSYAKDSKTIWVSFSKNKSNVKVENARNYHCMKTLDTYGIYQNSTEQLNSSAQKISFGWLPLIFIYAAEASVTTLFLFTIIWFLMRKRGSMRLKSSSLWFIGGFVVATVTVGVIRFFAAFIGLKIALVAHSDAKWLFFAIIPIMISVLICAFIRTRYKKTTTSQ